MEAYLALFGMWIFCTLVIAAFFHGTGTKFREVLVGVLFLQFMAIVGIALAYGFMWALTVVGIF